MAVGQIEAWIVSIPTGWKWRTRYQSEDARLRVDCESQNSLVFHREEKFPGWISNNHCRIRTGRKRDVSWSGECAVGANLEQKNIRKISGRGIEELSLWACGI